MPLITPLSAKNVLLVQQKLEVLKNFASSFIKWSVRKLVWRNLAIPK